MKVTDPIIKIKHQRDPCNFDDADNGAYVNAYGFCCNE